MSDKRNPVSKTAVWILMGLLFVGLAGFGATNLSGTVRTIGKAGDQTISANDYFREIQQEMRGIESQTGQPMTMEQARVLGLEQRALTRLLTVAALDHETAQMGLSIGDENLQEEILRIPAFRGLNGEFDREAYRFTLQQAGLSEGEFEDDLRAESARTLVQGAVLAGVSMPGQMTDTLVDFILARRSFTWATVTEDALETPIPAPSDADLQTYYDDNVAAFTLPETKDITYVVLTPEMVLDEIEVDEDALRALFAEREQQYQQPERRLVERLVFADENTAASAMAQLEVGGSNFDLLVEDRGLSLADVDMGDVTIEALGAAGQAVFAAEINDIVGPLPSDLGPALFRINGVLSARVTTFEQARNELRDELAADRARRVIETLSQDIDDLLAGGATLEELAQETDMDLGQIDWSVESFEGIAAYSAFRDAAAAVTMDDFAEVEFLEDGGIFALELRGTLPPRPEPFEDARDRVAAGWEQQAIEAALQAQTTSVVASLATGGDFVAAGLTPREEIGLTRSAFIEGTPPGLINTVFEMEPGNVEVIAAGGRVFVVQLHEILPPADTPDAAQLRAAFANQLDQSLASEVFDVFARDVQLRARPQVDQRAVDAVLNSFQ